MTMFRLVSGVGATKLFDEFGRFGTEPGNNGFQKDFPLTGIYFQVPC